MSDESLPITALEDHRPHRFWTRRSLTDAQVEDVRIRYSAGGISQVSLAREFGVRQQTISKAVNGIRYSHIPILTKPSPLSRPRYPGWYVPCPIVLTGDELERFWGKVSKSDNHWVWTALVTTSNYGQIKFRGKMRVAHVVSWMIHYGPVPDGMIVLHDCDFGPCVNPLHLRLGTHADNSQDMVAKGRHKCGSYVPDVIDHSVDRWVRPRGPSRPEILLAKRNLLLLDLSRTAFGRLRVTEFYGQDKNRKTLVLCECFCGESSVVYLSGLRKLSVQSCGCLRSDVARELSTTHGLSKLRIYSTFHSMHNRCYNKNSVAYSDYGGRGITVCARWHDLLLFAGDMGDPPGPEYSIDRINVNGNYEPSNCRWATRNVQAKNQRRYMRT